MKYRIGIAPAAQRELKKLQKKLSKADLKGVVDAIDNLATDPRPKGIEKLTGGDRLYRIRRGNMRIVYQIRDNELFIIVAKVADRKEMYVDLLTQAVVRIRNHKIAQRLKDEDR